MRDVLGVIAILGLLPLLLASVKWLSRRYQLKPELKRKAVHVGMGLATLSFPWIFTSVWAVAVLGLLSILALALVKRLEAQGGGEAVLHAVDRHSYGDILFPTAVVIVFWWADGEWIYYVIPVLILTLADAAGAIIGTKYGTVKFQILSGWKSLEGSALFFLVAFLSAHIPLLLGTQIGRAEVLLIALILAVVVMLFEAICTQGWDNLVVPLASAYLLRLYSSASVPDLLERLAIVGVMLLLILVTRRRTSLDAGGLMAIVILAYACWTCGDWRFLVPPLILYIEHLVTTSRLRKTQAPAHHDLYPVLSIGLSFLPFLLAARFHPEDRNLYLGTITLATAIHLAALNLATRVFESPHRATATDFAFAVGKGIVLVAVPGWLLGEVSGRAWVNVALSIPIVMLALVAFVFLQRNPREYSNGRNRWALQGLVAALGAAAGMGFPKLG